MSDHAEARRSHEESKRIQEARGDAAGVATSLAGLGDVANKLGEYELARECYEKNLAIMRTSESRPRFGVALNKLAIFNMYRGNLERSRELHEEHLALQREIGNLDGVAFACTGLATTLGQLREMDLAIASANEALAIRRRTGDKVHMATTLALLADLHHASHRRDAALPFLREAILIQRESGRPSGILHGIEVLSTIAEYADWHAESLTLMSAVSALRESLGEAPTEHARQVRDARVRKLTAALGEDGAHEASVAGRAMTLDDAASYALRVLDARRPVRGAGS